MTFFELNMDGLVGQTHHYAGLSAGNIASTTNAKTLSNPQQAALQGLKKMRLLHEMGLKQAVIPPHQRPNLALLKDLGFSGSIEAQLNHAKHQAPELLSAAFSASSMWTANMATVSSSVDTADKRLHFTAANLIHNIHRSLEADFSAQLLKKIFSNEQYFTHHAPLPKTNSLSDEGAANHSRICKSHGGPGINLFTYGKRTLPTNQPFEAPIKFPARQTLEASQAIARRHLLDPKQTFFAQQTPTAIDAGVFHNDVISVANESVFLLHEDAFLNQPLLLENIQQAASFPIHMIEIKRADLSLQSAVNSYLFNSQLLTQANGKMTLVAPHECEASTHIKALVDAFIQDPSNPITNVHYLNLKQSMQNGGGPACLRLRVPLTQSELNEMHQGILITHELLDTLEQWVLKHYRTQLQADDLIDPALILECFTALDELTSILNLGSIYPFQKEIL